MLGSAPPPFQDSYFADWAQINMRTYRRAEVQLDVHAPVRPQRGTSRLPTLSGRGLRFPSPGGLELAPGLQEHAEDVVRGRLDRGSNIMNHNNYIMCMLIYIYI